MLAFADYHSVMEVRRYLARFMMHSPGLKHLQGILHTEYNEYDSIIKPLQLWLTSLGVQFRPGTTVEEIEMSADNNTATRLHLRTANGPSEADLLPQAPLRAARQQPLPSPARPAAPSQQPARSRLSPRRYRHPTRR